MTWRLAKSLETLRSQVNAKWPNRSKDSDGSIGDERHQNEKTSDHNPWVKDGNTGVVTAIDITHDPKGGFDSYAFADMLLRNRDSRIKYVISNRRIGSGGDGPSSWTWRKYTGSNAHDHHCHISVKSSKAYYDGTQDWVLAGLPLVAPGASAEYIRPPATLREGSTGEDVKKLQAKLHVFIDGEFGPKTETSLKKFQADHKLTADGICGPQSWAALQ
jgi:peptidoglycan hydrolase-like protein with peptidoglycan-binding domain